MRSRFSLFYSAVFVLGLSAPVLAQDQAAYDEGLQMMREGRKVIIADELYLTREEGPAFWEAYEAYRDQLDPITTRYSKLVTGYVEAYDAGEVTEELALGLIEDYLEIQMGILEVRRDHLPVFREILPAFKAARFYQLEFNIDAEIEAELALVVPLVDLLRD